MTEPQYDCEDMNRHYEFQELRDLRKQHNELARATRTILRGFHEGVFVRSVDGDSQPGWAIRLLPFIGALSAAVKLLGGDGCLGEDCQIHGGPNTEGQ